MNEVCPGCKAVFPHSDVKHRYGVSSGGCYQHFNEFLAFEAEVYGYPPVHRLIVDAYSVQHPQNVLLQEEVPDRLRKASIQSVAVHLLALYLAIEKGVSLEKISKLMARIISFSRGGFLELTPPEKRGKVTIENMTFTKNKKAYDEQAWEWARSAWDAWKDHKGYIISLANHL